LPAENVAAFLKATTEFFIKKATATSDEKMKLFCIEKAIQFLHDQQHLAMMSKWMTEPDSAFKLDPAQRYSVLKTYFACPHFDIEQKRALKDAVLKDDTTDEGKICEKACELLLPDAALKEELWKQINDAESKESLKDLTQRVTCFFQRK
jgi:hypothetical protein